MNNQSINQPNIHSNTPTNIQSNKQSNNQNNCQASNQTVSQMTSNQNNIQTLSSDVLSLCLLFLSPFELCSAAAVCRTWLNLTTPSVVQSNNQSIKKSSVLWRQSATNTLVQNRYMKPSSSRTLVNVAPTNHHSINQSTSQSSNQTTSQSINQSTTQDLTVPAMLYMMPRWPRGFDSVPMISISGHEHEMIVERDWPAEELYQDYEKIMNAVVEEKSKQAAADEIDEDMKLRDAFQTGLHNAVDNRVIETETGMNSATRRFYADLRVFIERERKRDADDNQANNVADVTVTDLENPAPLVDAPMEELPEQKDQSTDHPNNQADLEAEDDDQTNDDRPVGWSIRGGAKRARSATSDVEDVDVTADENDQDADNVAVVDENVDDGDAEMHDENMIDADQEGGWYFEEEDEDQEFDSEGEENGIDEDEEFDSESEDDDDDAPVPDPAILFRQALQVRGTRSGALDAIQYLLDRYDAAMEAQQNLIAARQAQQDRLRQTCMRLGTLMLSDDDTKQDNLHQGARQRRREERWLAQSKNRTAFRLSDSEDEEADPEEEEKEGEHINEPVSRVRYAYTRRNRDRAIVLDEPFPLRNPQLPIPFTVLEWMSVDKFQQLQAQANESNSLSASQILPSSQAPPRPAHLSHDYVPVLRPSLVAYFEINIENEDVEEVNRMEREYFEAVARRRRENRMRQQQAGADADESEDDEDDEDDPGDAVEVEDAEVRAGYDVVQVAQHRFAARSQCVALGICNQQFPLFGKQPGWDRHSFGYHGDDGNCFYNSGRGAKFGPSYGAGDTVGLAFNYIDGTISFTRNGCFVGVHPASRDHPLEGEWYGCVGIDSRRTIRINMHGPFVFDTNRFDQAIQRTGSPPLDFVACKRFFQSALRARQQIEARAKAERAKAAQQRRDASDASVRRAAPIAQPVDRAARAAWQ